MLFKKLFPTVFTDQYLFFADVHDRNLSSLLKPSRQNDVVTTSLQNR